MKVQVPLTHRQKAIALMVVSAAFLLLTICCVGWTIQGSLLAVIGGIPSAYIACVASDKARYEWRMHKLYEVRK